MFLYGLNAADLSPGLFTTIAQEGGDVCAAKADLDTVDLDNLAYDLAQNWQPTGFYTPDVIQQMVAKWNERSQDARQAIQGAWGKATPDQQTSLLQDMLDSLGTFDTQAQKYLDAAANADIVSAPKLKEWILGGIDAASSSLHAAEVVICQHDQDWTPLVALGQWLYTVGGVAKDVVQAAYASGKNVVQASESLLGILGWVVTHPWTVFAIIAAAVTGALMIRNADKLETTFTRFRKG